MATQTTPFQGTKFYIGTGTEQEKAITAVSLKPATVTVTGHGFKAGDCIKLTGLGELDGFYPVKSIASDVITLADEVNWADRDQPDLKGAKVAKVKWSANFGAVRNLERSEDTISEEDITTMGDEGTVTKAGEIEFGSTKLTFFKDSSSAIQQLLREKFFAKETFPFLLIFKKNLGSIYGTGFIQSLNNYSGETKGKFEAGATIKHSKRDYYLSA